jgi:AcrR family transcriptional regulator
MAVAEPDVEHADGRRARGARSRTAVVEAILELLHELDRQPTVDEIAARAGVSERSVFRHFEDTEALFTAAIETHARQNARLWEVPPTSGSRAERIDALVANRARLYEAISPVRRVAEHLRRRSPAIDRNLTAMRTHYRDQLARLFAAELEAGATDRDLLDALEAGSSWHHWEQLRRDQALTRTSAARVTAATLAALLA